VLLGQTNSGAFGAIFYLSGAALMFITSLITERGPRPRPVDYAVGAIAGLCSGLAILFMLLAASLPTAVLFPITQGLGLLGGVVLATAIYRERLTPLKLLGLALGLAVLLTAGLRSSIMAVFAGVR
jgi:multidrug transporter EmrE-like cation transporter